MRLQNKTALITGAASGIGRAAALRLAREGAAVFLLDRDEAGVQETAAQITAEGGRALACGCDVSSEEAVTSAVSAAHRALGGLDILVNVAGVQVTKALADTSFDDYHKMMDVNVGGVFLTMRAVLPLMKQAGHGSIVNVASELAFVGYSELAVYTATKGALVSMSRSAALEAIPCGVRVNCVCPGATDTPIFWEGETDPERRRQMLEQVRIEKPCGRLITPEEVASGILFLASDEASGVVGTCLVIDGGFTAQ